VAGHAVEEPRRSTRDHRWLFDGLFSAVPMGVSLVVRRGSSTARPAAFALRGAPLRMTAGREIARLRKPIARYFTVCSIPSFSNTSGGGPSNFTSGTLPM